jgi:hypothetical protein
MPEHELDRLLSAWLAEGAAGTPDRIAEHAMLEITTVPQERGLLRTLQASFADAPLAWAAVFLALAIGLGLVLGPALVGEQPQPLPSESPIPNGMVLVSSRDDGYELFIPEEWQEVDAGYEDSRKWSGPDGELMVSYGTSIVDGSGEVTLCFPPLPDYNTCMPAEYSFSIPISPEDTQPVSLEGYLDRCDGGCPVTATDTSLDQEEAVQDRLVVTDLQLTYVSAFHFNRPIILYWAEPIDRADQARVELMRESFRFLDVGSAPPPDPTEQVLFTDADQGYEILLPRFWRDSASALLDPAGTPYPGVTAFGSGTGAGTSEAPGLTISIGQPDGSVFANCVPGAVEPPYGDPVCHPLTATTLDELGAALISVPLEFAESGAPDMPVEVQADLTLSGEPAREERPTYLGDGHSCLGCPGMLYHAYTVHNGRQAVLAFDFWNVEFERISPAYLTEMLESFRFLD